MSDERVTCDKCGTKYGVGDSPFCRDGHQRVLPSKGFEPHFDEALGAYVTGIGDRRKAMREKQLDYRDHMSKGDQSARLDRIHQRPRHRAS